MDPVTEEPVIRHFGVWDYVVFGIMLLVSALIGIFSAFSGDRQRTADEFLVGNRKMGIIPVAMSITVSYISAVSVVGTPAEIYIYGTMFTWVLVTYVLGNILLCRLFLPIYFRIRIISVYEYLELRFNRALRRCVTIIFSIQTILYMGIVMYTPALTLNAVTGFSLWACVLTTGAVCIFYTTLGGIKAVLWTDTLQAVVIMIGIIAVIIKGSIDVGGLDRVWQITKRGNRVDFGEVNPDPRIVYSIWSMLIGYTSWNLATGAGQVVVQRMLTCGSLKKATQAVILATITKVFVIFLCIFAGVVMYAYYVDCDPLTQGVVTNKDQIMPLMVMDVFAGQPGLPGLFLSAVVSASLSTLSSGINSLAAVAAEDGVKAIWPNMKPQTYVKITKLLALGYGLLAIGFAFLASLLGTGILQLVLSIDGVFTGCTMGVFILGIFMHRSNYKGAIAGLIGSFIFMTWLKVGAVLYPSTRGQNALSVEGCPIINATEPMYTGQTTASGYSLLTEKMTTMAPDPTNRPPVAEIYSISFLYYTPIGSLVCVIVGMLVSGITGFTDPNSLDVRLKYNITDAIFCCLPEFIKKWMRCGVDKVKYQYDDYDTEKFSVIRQNGEDLPEVYLKRVKLDENNFVDGETKESCQ